MTRTATLALVVVVVAGLLAGAVVLAKDIQCLSGKCVGTKKADEIVGSFGPDTIFARGGNDTIFAESGDDEIRGSGGIDTIIDDGGNDEIHGGDANDIILDFGPGPDVDTIFGDDGDDSINVREGAADVDPDVVDCGSGTDKVTADPGDTLIDCEILIP